MSRLTRYRTEGALCERLVAESFPTLLWLAEKGVRFVPIFGRQSFMVDGKMKFWGGVVVESWGGGPGLFDQELRIARDHGVEVRYGARALSLLTDGHRVTGVRVKHGGSIHDLRAAAVVLASGEFGMAAWSERAGPEGENP